MSKITAAADILSLKLRVTWSEGLIHCSVEQWRSRKTNLLALSTPLSSICFWSSCRINFSNCFLVVRKRQIGRKFWGNFGCLPGLGKVITFVSFFPLGKLDSRMQWLNKWVRLTNGYLGMCRRHSFGMPSITQAILNIKNLLISLSHMVFSFEGVGV
jgi:hypothetical protein